RLYQVAHRASQFPQIKWREGDRTGRVRVWLYITLRLWLVRKLEAVSFSLALSRIVYFVFNFYILKAKSTIWRT
ncbi:MAG: hypothetical protein ACI87N_003547, partial [Flavobacteriales bacterium]